MDSDFIPLSYIDATNMQYVIMNYCNYQILDIDTKSDTCIIKVEYPDIETCLENVNYECTDEELTDIIYNWINSEDVIYNTEEIEVIIKNDNLKWYIVENDYLINVYTGGIYHLLNVK